MSSSNNRNNGSTVVVVKKKRFDLNKYKAQKSQKEVEVAAQDAPEVKVKEDSSISSSFEKGHEIKASTKIKNLDLDKDFAVAPEVVEPPVVKKEVKKTKPQKSNKFENRDSDLVREDHKVNIPNLDDLLTKKKEEEVVPKKKISGLKLVDDNKSKIIDRDEKEKQSTTKARFFEERRGNTRYIDEDEKVRSLSSLKRQREKIKRAGQDSQNKPVEQKVKEVVIPETITVQELANRMAVRSTDLVKELMKMGMMITATKPIDADTAELLATELGYVVKRVSESDVENILDRSEYKDVEKMQSRAPIISVMGHVDHGKTSLLDALRTTNVVDGESGGITQHIGASRIKTAEGKFVTFLDTPGHEAFTAMRMRGAKATDMVILVVAADDGVKEQTIEAINHAKAANIPIIVAVNKIDKDGADPQQVLNGLLAHDIIVESLGGDVLYVEVSAKQKINLDKLLDVIMLQSELLELKANYDCPAKGVVIETKVDKNKGVIATLLVQHGKLRVGDIVLAGMSCGRVRAIIDDNQRKLDVAEPSVPVEILGLDEVPDSGDVFYVMENDRQAREIVEYRIQKQKDLDAAQKSKKTLEDIFSDLGDGQKKELSLIVKGDVRGSVEAIKTSIEKLSTEEVKVRVIHGGVGGISDSDLTLAKASDASILAFNVRAGSNLKSHELDKVDVRYYSIIYDLVDDVKAAMKGMLDPKKKEVFLGKGEIRKVFDLSKYGKIAGSYVLEGVIKRNSPARIIRDSIVIHDGKVKALKRYKDDAKEVSNGMEFGISFEGFTDFREGDIVESYDLLIEKE